MASGAAVVSTDIRSVRTFAGDAVLYAPTGDAEMLSEQVVRLLRDELLCAKHQELGQAAVSALDLGRARLEFESALFKAISGSGC
jgi:hypothetical protein